MARSRPVQSLAGAGVVGSVLVAAAPHPSVLTEGLADPERWVRRDGFDVVLAQFVGTVAWLVALWLALGFVLVAGSRLPGVAGRTSALLARGTLPAGMRRTAAVALGVSLATSAGTIASLPNAAAGGWEAPSAAAPTSPHPLHWPADVDRLPSRADLATATSGGTADWPPSTTSATGTWPHDAVDWAAVTAQSPLTLLDDETASSSEAVDWPSAAEPPPIVPAKETPSPSEAVDWPSAAEPPPIVPAKKTASPSEAVDWPSAAQQSPIVPATEMAASAEAVDWPSAAQQPPIVLAKDTAASAEAVDWPGVLAEPPAIVLTTARRPAGAGPAAAVDWPVRGGEDRSAVDRPLGGAADQAAAVDWPMGGASVPAPRSIAAYSAIARRAAPVVVAPGDTLWSIASRRLGPGATAPAVAVEWRRWHAANRSLIGSDPRRLRPGTTLRPPATS